MKKSIKKLSLIVMICAFSLVGFSSAVYGRFTRQFNPEVSSFGVTIATHENILVSNSDDPGTFKDAIRIQDLVSDEDVTLTPVMGKVTTTEDGEHQHFTLTKNGMAAPARNYLTFDLYFISSTDMNLYLKGSTSGTVSVFEYSTADEHFQESDKQRLLDNLRVGFLTYSTTYQPSGTGIEPVYSDSPVLTNIYSRNVVSTDNYTTFNRLGYSNTASDRIIATTTKNEVVKMQVYVWIEEDGMPDIEAIGNLTLHLRFEAIVRE